MRSSLVCCGPRRLDEPAQPFDVPVEHGTARQSLRRGRRRRQRSQPVGRDPSIRPHEIYRFESRRSKGLLCSGCSRLRGRVGRALAAVPRRGIAPPDAASGRGYENGLDRWLTDRRPAHIGRNQRAQRAWMPSSGRRGRWSRTGCGELFGGELVGEPGQRPRSPVAPAARRLRRNAATSAAWRSQKTEYSPIGLELRRDGPHRHVTGPAIMRRCPRCPSPGRTKIKALRRWPSFWGEVAFRLRGRDGQGARALADGGVDRELFLEAVSRRSPTQPILDSSRGEPLASALSARRVRQNPARGEHAIGLGDPPGGSVPSIMTPR